MEDNQAQVAAESSVDQSAPAPASTLTDIDSLSEFQFQGQKYTPEKLQKVFSEHQKYSSELPEVSKYRDFAENLEIDLEKVLKDPSLAARFKEIYPKQYHSVLDRLIGARPDASQEAKIQGALPKEAQDRISKLEQTLEGYEQKAYQAEVAKHEAYLQKVVDPLFEKYPFADQDAVYAKAEAMIGQKYQMNDGAWERLIKENHLATKKKAESLHQRALKEQIEKGSQAQDTGPGGAAPGQAPPQRPRTFEEATNALVAKMRKAP